MRASATASRSARPILAKGRRGRPAHRRQDRVAHQLVLRRLAPRGAQDGRRHLLGDVMVGAGGQRGAPHGIEVVLHHDATLREATGPCHRPKG